MNTHSLIALFAATILGGVLFTGADSAEARSAAVASQEAPSLSNVIPPRPIGIYSNPNEFLPAGVQLASAN